MTKIGLISDNSIFLNNLTKNLSLLRKNDTFLRYSFEEFKTANQDAEIILIYAENSKINEDFINKVKNENNYIIMFLPKTREEQILKLYDYGFNDFCRPDAPLASIIVKIVNGQKFLSLQKLNETYKNILSSNEILKENNSVYKSFDNVLSQKLSKTLLRAAFLAIDIPNESRERFISENLEMRMVTALRASDIIINYTDFSYFLILTDTEFDKVKLIFEKLSNSLDIKITGFQLRYKSLNKTEILEKIENLRAVSQKEMKRFVIECENTSFDNEKDWLQDAEEEPKNYKFFRVMYDSKVEKVIKPTFFRMREKYEDILTDTRIKYSFEKDSAQFNVLKGDKVNSLKITFTNSPNLNVQLTFSGIYAPENVEYSIPFAQVNIKKLIEIIEEFINEGINNEIDK